MNKLVALLILLFLFACASEDATNSNDEASPKLALKNEGSTDKEIDVALLYKTHCGGCHGMNLEGNSATALIKDEWTYGHSKWLMSRNVSYGIAGTDMAAFKDILNQKEISGIVDYIVEKQDLPANEKKAIPTQLKTKDYEIAVEQIAPEGLENPWAIEFVNANKALVSEKKGQLRWLVNGELDGKAIEGTPITTTATSTGGYMDIALDPDYSKNGWVYLSYSHTDEDLEDKSAAATTKIVRGKIKDHQWTEEQTLFEVPKSLWVKDGNRWGCRLLFDDQKRLYFTIGDMAQAEDSQDLAKATGKVFRINADGSIPKDNPFINKPDALPQIFSIGNRNVQGLDFHPATGELWGSEHGPMGGDELNILRSGANYGWPVITYGIDYSGDTVSTKTHQEGMEQPAYLWKTSIAVCPITFVKNDMFPNWQNNLLVGALAFEELKRYVIEDGKVVGEEMLLDEVGRVRDVKMAPDGSIYVVMNKPDVILRLSNVLQ